MGFVPNAPLDQENATSMCHHISSVLLSSKSNMHVASSAGPALILGVALVPPEISCCPFKSDVTVQHKWGSLHTAEQYQLSV